MNFVTKDNSKPLFDYNLKKSYVQVFFAKICGFVKILGVFDGGFLLKNNLNSNGYIVFY